MPSDFLTPFLEVDEEFSKSFCSLEATGSSNNKSSWGVSDSTCWGVRGPAGEGVGQRWRGEGQLPRSSLSHIPFRVDRSVSLIEANEVDASSPLPPPPGFYLRSSSPSSSSSPSTSSSPSSSRAPPPSPHLSTRYKTELCRTFEESGICKYGTKCQFAHGVAELRGLSRHPKYKTEPCRTFHSAGFCPYGARCHFIHNADEGQTDGGGRRPRPPLRHSLSFAGFSSLPQAFHLGEEPSSLLFARASSVSPPPSSPLLPEPGAVQRCRLFSGMADSAGDLGFHAVTDSARCSPFRPPLLPPRPPPGLQRCYSTDSLSEEVYASSCSLSSTSSGAESPSLEVRRLPIFSRLSITDE